MLKHVFFLLSILAFAKTAAQNTDPQPVMRQVATSTDTLRQTTLANNGGVDRRGLIAPDSTVRFALPVLDFSAPGFNGLSPWNYGVQPVWQMHQGFNAQLGLSVTAGFGKGAPHGVGFSQQAAFGYAMPLSKRFALAVGVYANNMDWGAFNQREAGVAAAVQYQVNESVNIYAYGAKSFFPDSNNRRFRYGWPIGYGRPAPMPGCFWGIPSERVGAMAEIKLGKNAMIQVSVEHQKY